MIGAYARAVTAAAICAFAPMTRARPAPLAPAECRPAPREMLERAQLPHERAALVLSLWRARTDGQCAVAARYDIGADLPRQTPKAGDARALQAQLAAAGLVAAYAQPIRTPLRHAA